MALRILWAVLALHFIALTGCGPRHKQREHLRAGVTKKQADAKAGDAGGAPTQPQDSTPISPPFEEGGTVAPLLTQEERKADIPAYEMPAPLRERIRKELPEFEVPSQSAAFQVTGPSLNVNVKNSTLTFSGILKIPGRPDENLELRCSFDKSKAWSCSNMFPTDPAVAAERRLQATANCVDLYRCDQMGMELFVRINGRIESQMFQTTKFSVRRASSGDAQESETPDEPQQPTPGGGLSGGPQPQPEPLPSQQPKDEELSPEELGQILDDSNTAVEIAGPIAVPPPTAGEFSIPEIEKLRPITGAGVREQAIGLHYRGHLENAVQLPKQGPGYAVRSGPDRSFGTDFMIELIRGAAAEMEKSKPGRPVVMVADISQKFGGRLGTRSGGHHASHQTGLDADVAFPSNNEVRDLWSALNGGKISSNLDEERLWTLMSSMTCAEDNPVIAIFLDTSIKKHMCRWAKGRTDVNDPSSCAFKTLRALKYEPGHDNHMHVRLRCPGNMGCRNATVTLGKSTGC